MSNNNYTFYPLDILYSSSFNNIIFYLSFIYDEYKDVLYSVLQYNTCIACTLSRLYVCATCMCRYLVRYLYLLAMLQEISLSKIVYF